MPITQSRLAELLLTAEDFAQALNHLIDQVQRFADTAKASGYRVEPSALSMLLLTSDPMALLRRPVESSTIVRLEREKYKSTFRRNFRRAEELRIEREKEGRVTQSSKLAPTSLFKPRISIGDHPASASAAEAELERMEAVVAERVAKGQGHVFPRVAGTGASPPPAAPAPPTKLDDRVDAAEELREAADLTSAPLEFDGEPEAEDGPAAPPPGKKIGGYTI